MGIVMLIVMTLGFLVGALYVWAPLEQITIDNSLRDAREVGAILYRENFGVSMVAALFAWIFVAGVVVGGLPLVSDRMAAHTFLEYYFGKPDPRPAVARAAAAAQATLSTRLEDEADARRYVRRFTTGWVGWFAIPAIVLTLLSAALAICDVQSYTLYTRDGAADHPFFPWQSAQMRSWDDATRVELGCNHVTGRGASDDPVYSVMFRDGSAVRLDDAVAIGGTWLDRMEQIDARLIESGALFRRWDGPLNRNPLHPECLAANRTRLSRDDYQRLLTLLRANT
jgi:hypothetical protein